MKATLFTLFTLFMCTAVACTGDPTSIYTGLPDAGVEPPAVSEPEPGPEPDPDPDPPPGPDASAPTYIDAQVYFQTSEEIDAWYAIVNALKSDFDEICGDTFCEGDFSNYESLRFRCSVEESTGTIGSCVWAFAASNEEIVPATGAIVVTGHIFRCAMPIETDTGILDFLQALAAPGIQPLQAPLPGTDKTPYDGLLSCL